MLYLVSSLAESIKATLLTGEFALLVTPYSNYNLHELPGVVWAADNGCFSKKWKQDRWWNWLVRNQCFTDRCLFATAPDVVGDHSLSLPLSVAWMPRIRSLGYPVAFVLQDGCERADQVPWDLLDWVFVGGTTVYKESRFVELLLAEARARGKRCHMGRVNSLRRMKIADAWGCETVDGTFLSFGPDTNLPRLRRYMAVVNQPQLEM